MTLLVWQGLEHTKRGQGEAVGEGLASGAVGKSGYQSNDYCEKMIKDRSRHLIEMTGLRDKMCVS